jgi:cytoskeletal protein CcmA (bactofilin family)
LRKDFGGFFASEIFFIFTHKFKNTMFGNKETSSANTATTSTSAGSGSINTIVRDTEITGNIKTASDLRIDGKLKGDIDCSGKLILGASGKVDGDVTCGNAVIEGTYTGNMLVSGTLTLRETSVLNGKVQVGKLVVQTGAVFNANCTMS